MTNCLIKRINTAIGNALNLLWDELSCVPDDELRNKYIENINGLEQAENCLNNTIGISDANDKKYYIVYSFSFYTLNGPSITHLLCENIKVAELEMGKEIEYCRTLFDGTDFVTKIVKEHYEKCFSDEGFGYVVGIKELPLL